MMAASVMAAGSVIKDPSSGTTVSSSQKRAMASSTGNSVASRTTRARATDITGREADTTMMAKTNSGSV